MRPYSDNQYHGYDRHFYGNQGPGNAARGGSDNPNFRGARAPGSGPNPYGRDFPASHPGPGFGPIGSSGWNPDFASGTFVSGYGNAPRFGRPGFMPGRDFDQGPGGESALPDYRQNGLPDDDEIVEMIYDAFEEDPLIPWNADIEVHSDAGMVTLTGTVTSRQIKHAAGDDAWWIPGVDDVRNEIRLSNSFQDPTANSASEPVQLEGFADVESAPPPVPRESALEPAPESIETSASTSGESETTTRRRARRA